MNYPNHRIPGWQQPYSVPYISPTHAHPFLPRYRKRNILCTAWLAVIVIVVVLGVMLPVIFVTMKSKSDASSGFPSGSTLAPTTGGNGSIITLENGTEFTYINPFGGFWSYDPSNPFKDDAKPNSWTPALNEPWDWSTNHINGINLGGLFVLEAFITPDLFQRYPGTEDEFQLSQAMAQDTANGGLGQLERHYDTFITEQDIAEIAGVGLNYIRLPIPFWTIETWEGETYMERSSWKYILRVIEWARKYGLRVCLDLHAVPGSQNGYNHSGRLSTINFLHGNMGYANAQRTLYYIRVLTQFFSQPQYRNLVTMFSIVNEPIMETIGRDTLQSFYLAAYDLTRSITGLGEGNGPYMVIHDGFLVPEQWADSFVGADRLVLDQHLYLSFGDIETDPITPLGPDGLPGGRWPQLACDAFASKINDSKRNFGITITGEFSGNFNDCGLFIRGIANPNSSHPQCPEYNDWHNFNQTMKEGLHNFALASMDAFQDWFFWTWKIGPSITGEIGAPLWSYQLGYRNGWLPLDPRTAIGKCASLKTPQVPFDGNYQPWQTGNTASSTSIPKSFSDTYPWPPATILGAEVPMSIIPSYTSTGSVVTLPPPTFTSLPNPITEGFDGWFNQDDTAGGVFPIQGCSYPDEYDGSFTGATPTAPCTG